jgi:tRNA G10  N-methylase Trm11
MQSLLVLGRQPALGLAELESLYGADKLRPVGNQAVIVDVDPCLLAFDRLGGSTKFCKVLTELDTTNWKEIEQFLVKVSPGHVEAMPEGKMRLGLSLIGFDIGVRQIEATGLTVKKAIRQTGRSVRLVPNKAVELNAAQVIHNQLTNPTGWELVFIKNGHKTVVAQTVKVQDIDSYARRDRDRPKRDAKVGMLPPKLAQILINLGAGALPEDKLENICDIPAGQPIPKPLLNKNVLDPFCGTGVVLQEALLMGYSAYGSDLDQRMVDYSIVNVLEWFRGWYDFETGAGVEVGDATTASWDLFPEFDFVAAETYLGRPFTSTPSAEIVAQTASDTNLIIKKFLNNIHGQIKPGTRLALAVPAWQIRPNQFKHLPLIDSLSDLGYNRVSFEHAGDGQLIYYRPGQTVARQLIVITRK